ncbi:MAG: hypothetical protein ACRC2J_08000, partial [Microcoleaceae cyanobacterium]
FGQPSYFAVMLNTPTPQKDGGTGININYKISGGTATLDNRTTNVLGDYKVASDGTIRIAPGEVQNNIVIVPIDDKLTEDLRLNIDKATEGTTDPKTGKTKLTLDVSIPIQDNNVSEPNNSDTQYGNLGGANELSFSNLAIGPSSTDQDWYKLTLQKKGDSKNYFEIDPSDSKTGDLDVVLYKASNTSQPIRSSTLGGTKADKIILDSLDAGDYFVKVYGYLGSMNDYNVKLNAPLVPETPLIVKGSAIKFGNNISGKVTSNTVKLGSDNNNKFPNSNINEPNNSDAQAGQLANTSNYLLLSGLQIPSGTPLQSNISNDNNSYSSAGELVGATSLSFSSNQLSITQPSSSWWGSSNVDYD